MPPTDETSRPSRRRALGRGPGTGPAPRDVSEPAAEAPAGADPAGESPACALREVGERAAGVVAPTPPLPETGGEPPAPQTRAPRDAGEPAAEGVAPGGAAEAEGPDGAVREAPAERGGDGRFTVRLANFEGPFDLLLQLIAKHKLDVTEVALSKVTDEFMAYIRAMGADWDLDQTTEFLVVAATLLDLKAARLLPAAEVEDEADLALLEARDLLFARLLQYRAYKQIAEIFDRRLDDEARRFPRTVGLEPHHAELLPDVVISIGAEGFARLAVKAMQPKPKPQVYVDHIHAPLVSVREQAEVVVALLRERGRATFRELTEGVDDTLTVVARFLALLELYREKALVLDQEEALGELTVTWAAGDGAAAVTVTDEFDQVVEEKE
ncbi:segregation/condensation protein A [Streptomyces sp. PKU-EA00015]|uniref:segregation/condensation protein A n=1 Tax=Streptomyces sp. PKU-EA00015 TaxID=2748326 RepID=UPI0015A48EC8|nr:segregation/condensation protein A [Streptomyces sp. PKU-EA00015]NWF28645.1 segregation/condensation protein A [Streptomyces sp. PKU-EA00015]